MLFIGAEIQLLDGKGLIKKECLQSTFKSNDSVTNANIDWYRVSGGSCRMSKGSTRCNRSSKVFGIVCHLAELIG